MGVQTVIPFVFWIVMAAPVVLIMCLLTAIKKSLKKSVEQNVEIIRLLKEKR
ncbi:hypothetical protein [Bacillus sonorensis]|uniref:hypothetical protein n=1 Tax=Bacillus sonorensis TaxID=119858 RepID=UPI00227F2781|nr:hypothetical protein [Bacillus sonorensis]MCY7855106.1 hypothetical protein [Bacillus sonorensis]MCY8090359.1 hypothetical protein [Bacillus sonorensis]MCY8405753.1 hypothetical protein [Bacillus sonorensis]MEC1504045.1 hypothetical protein [Bacillus sonorensis]MEC1536110.1 hypothetical protein [Bacillus sonorensis]